MINETGKERKKKEICWEIKSKTEINIKKKGGNKQYRYMCESVREREREINKEKKKYLTNRKKKKRLIIEQGHHNSHQHS